MFLYIYNIISLDEFIQENRVQFNVKKFVINFSFYCNEFSYNTNYILYYKEKGIRHKIVFILIAEKTM